jgi:hypothetical protein
VLDGWFFFLCFSCRVLSPLSFDFLGTWSSSDFLQISQPQADESLYIVSPVGYPGTSLVFSLIFILFFLFLLFHIVFLLLQTLLGRIASSPSRKPFNTFFCKGLDPTAPTAAFTDAEREGFFFIPAPSHLTRHSLCQNSPQRR